MKEKNKMFYMADSGADCLSVNEKNRLRGI